MFSVVIPAFNEEKSLLSSNFIEELIKLLNEKFNDFEIIIVDDGSIDKTLDTIKKLSQKYAFLKILTHARNKGYGSSLKSGINFAKYDTIVITDIDGTYVPKDILKILNIYLDSKNSHSVPIDMVVGARTGQNLNESFLKLFLRFLLRTIVQISAGSKISDINSGLRVFSKKTIKKTIPNLSNLFSFTTTSTLAYLSRNLSIVYCPIDYLKRKGRKSHVKLFRDSIRTLQYVVEATIFYNPLKFFLILSTFIFLNALFFLIIYIFSKIIFFDNLFFIFLFLGLLSLLFGFIAVLIHKVSKN